MPFLLLQTIASFPPLAVVPRFFAQAFRAAEQGVKRRFAGVVPTAGAVDYFAAKTGFEAVQAGHGMIGIFIRRYAE